MTHPHPARSTGESPVGDRGETPMPTLVSIAIPAYRPGAVFRETLRTCLEQDYPNLEVVVALNGEDHAVRAAIADVDDPRVRLLTDERTWGQSENHNRALHASRGEYIKLLSADDLMAKDCITRMVEVLEANPTIGLCSARHLTFLSNDEEVVSPELELPVPAPGQVLVITPDQARWDAVLHGNRAGGPSNVMIRRSTLWRVGLFDPRVNYMGDFAYWNRAALLTGLAIVERPLIGYRRHRNSVTSRESFGMVRVDEPFAIADDATLGAWFLGEAWWRRAAWRVMTVNATASYALSMLLRRPRSGLRALWRVIFCGGVLLAPLTIPVALWSAVRSKVLRRGPLWPFRPEAVTQVVTAEGVRDARGVVDLLSEPERLDRLMRAGRKTAVASPETKR